MIKEINLNKFINVLGNKNDQKDIKLKVEGKKLKSGENIINIKSLVVSEKLFNDLGLKEEGVFVKTKQTQKPSLRDLILAMDAKFTNRFDSVDQRLDRVEQRLETIEQLPTIKKELKTEKKIKSLKQKQ